MSYSYKPHYIKGTWNQICQVCHETYKMDQLKQDWRGLWVCDTHYDDIHVPSILPNLPDPNELAPAPTGTGRENPADYAPDSTQQLGLLWPLVPSTMTEGED